MHTLAHRNPSQTDTAQFRRWFGASKVVDERGQPLVVYHGTTAGGFDAFRPNYRKGEQLGFGIHFAQDRGFAAKYAEDPTVARKGKTPKVYAVYLSIQRPLVADAIVYEGTPEFALAKKLAGSKLLTQRNEDGVLVAYMQNAIDKTSAQRAEKLIREAGYDGIVYEAQLATRTGMGWAKTGSSRSFIVFEPTQVKSATDNAGTFDPADLNIYRNPMRRNPDAEPLVLYHGAQRWEGPPSIVAHRKGHAEHGAGIYLTTSWTTANNYAKGGGSVYRFEVSPDMGWLEDARLPVTETVRWVKSLPRLKGKADIVATLERVAGRVGPNIPASILVAAFVNFGASAGQHGPSLAEYLVAHGIDASRVSRSMNEDWVVVFNPAKVLRVTRVPARETGEGFAFDLPRVKRKNPSRRNPHAACPTKLMKYEYLGTTDEVTTCDCCGKTNLKNTVAIRDLDEGEVLYFGVTCAARALKVQVADVKKGAADADRQRREEEFRRRDAENRANTALWHEWLIERTGGIYEYDRSPDVFRMIQALGGVAAARVGFEEWKAAKKARSNPRRGGRR